MPPTPPALCLLLLIPPVLFWDCHPCPVEKWEERGEVRSWVGLAELPLSLVGLSLLGFAEDRCKLVQVHSEIEKRTPVWE